MPSRNILKHDVAEAYYHIYARGGNRQAIFLDVSDRLFFISLFKRYLSVKPAKNKVGQTYPHYHGDIQLLAYCLMGNHFHILIYQHEAGAMSAFMRAIMTSYSRYFNHKYQRTGSLFESRYKASHIDSATYLDHISRYIHMNPRYWRRYKYSSLKYYCDLATPEWIVTEPILNLFKSEQDYLEFLKSYQQKRSDLQDIKSDLVNS
ncbi:MAG: transposase [Candidatus Saccharimonadales bacterium]